MGENRNDFDKVSERIIIISLYIVVAAMPFSIALTGNALGLACLFWLIRLLVTRKAKVHRLYLEWAFLAYIMAEVLSLIFSTNVPQSIIYSKRLFAIPIVYLIALNMKDTKHINRMVVLFIASVSIYSALGIVSYFISDTVRVNHIQNSMTTGGITMIGALACFAQTAAAADKQWRKVTLLFGIVNTVCLLLTSTRGSWMGFMFGLIMVFLLTKKKYLIVVPIIISIFYGLSSSRIRLRC